MICPSWLSEKIIMIRSAKHKAPYSYKIFSSEVVIFDSKGFVVVKCPTEDEAIEYLNEVTECQSLNTIHRDIGG